MADWCALPEGVVALIARRLKLIEDFIAFRATCTSWREGTTLKDFYSSASCPKLPLLMLYKLEMYDDDDQYEISVECFDERHQRKDPDEERKFLSSFNSAGRKFRSDYLRKHPADEREFLSLSKGKTCKFSFPEAKGMECRGSKGWFTMVERRTGNMRLLHPITRAQIPHPKAPHKVDIPILPKEFISAVLSASPSETSEYVVMVAFVVPDYIPGGYMGFWKPGNENWTRVEIPDCVEDLNYYKGKFYALTWGAQVWMCDVSGPNPNNKASKITELPWEWSRPKAQLVECGGRLLIVAPFIDYDNGSPYEYDQEMVELDVIKGSYSIITSLGSSTVFLGRNEGFSVDANKFRGIIEPNLIYFSDGSHGIAARGPNHHQAYVWAFGLISSYSRLYGCI